MSRSNQYDFTEAIASTNSVSVRGLTQRQRKALTGIQRNNAEANNLQGFLDTVEKEMQFRGPRGVSPLLRTIETRLNGLSGVLTLTSEVPRYASVWETPELNRRTVDEALAVAGANVRRAISSGDVGAAHRYLNMMRQAIDSASDEGRA